MSLDLTYGALADPTRRAILQQLAERQRSTVSELAAGLPIGMPTVMKHLDVLSRAGLIERRKEGRTVTVTLAPGGMTDARAWLREIEAFWSPRLERLTNLLEEKKI